jgi:tetratricopeptide (TPR) repeat protein
VHWADRAIAPGKKQWTWGDGEVGHAWDRHLTDSDGPYVELMAGVFTDNQPDFSWLAAGETRRFRQHWYPIQDIGPAVQASLDGAIGLEVLGTTVRLGVAATAEHDATLIVLRHRDGARVAEWSTPLAPGRPFTTTLELDRPADRDDLVVDVEAGDRLLVRWRAHPGDTAEPWVATEPPTPDDIASADELYLTGLHLVQYRHPTRPAEPYFREAVRRDPGDSRAHVALARLALARAEYALALDHLDRAIDRLTRRNLNPEHGDAHLLRGLVLERLGRRDEAALAFGKASWDGRLALPANLGRARLALRDGDAASALEFAGAALAADRTNTSAIAARVTALRKLGGADADIAAADLAVARAADPLDPLLAAIDGELHPVDPRTLLTIAHELHRLGDVRRATELARRASDAAPTAFGNPAPLAGYALAAFLDAAGDHDRAAAARARARAADPRLAFPAGLDDHDALVAAIAADGEDARARGYLGCWLLDAGRTSEALEQLERATRLGTDDPVVWRNAAVALVKAGGDLADADRRYAEALTRSPGDARLVYERDQLAALRGTGAAERLAAIRAAGAAVLERDDLAIEFAGLLVEVGRAQEALDFLAGRSFQPFEGGEGKVIAVYDRASLAVAREHIAERPEVAAALLRDGLRVPEHLGEGRHPADPIAERLVLLGDAEAASGDEPAADAAWRAARTGAGALAVDARPVDERDHWIAVAHSRLGEWAQADAVWRSLEERAAELEASPDRVDYFATSLPELLLFPVDSAERRGAQAARLRALAAEGRRMAEVRA